jgi:hypothetical protein
VHSLLLKRNKGSRERALNFLSNAMLAGYGIDTLASDPDLDSLRDDDDFATLLRTIEISQRRWGNRRNEPADPETRQRDESDSSPTNDV